MFPMQTERNTQRGALVTLCTPLWRRKPALDTPAHLFASAPERRQNDVEHAEPSQQPYETPKEKFSLVGQVPLAGDAPPRARKEASKAGVYLASGMRNRSRALLRVKPETRVVTDQITQ
jgi:hypothetical protein